MPESWYHGTLPIGGGCSLLIIWGKNDLPASFLASQSVASCVTLWVNRFLPGTRTGWWGEPEILWVLHSLIPCVDFYFQGDGR